MFAKINHMAMVSPIYPMLANFYEAFFGLKRSGKVSRPLNAVTVGDGYVGLNINPLRDGYVGGLDHFGFPFAILVPERGVLSWDEWHHGDWAHRRPPGRI